MGGKKKEQSQSQSLSSGRNMNSDASKAATSKSAKKEKGKGNRFFSMGGKKTNKVKKEEEKQQDFQWTPNLDFYLGDAELRDGLMKHCKTTFQGESLQFVIMVDELERKIEDINTMIKKIYEFQDYHINVAAHMRNDLSLRYRDWQQNMQSGGNIVSLRSFDGKSMFNEMRIEVEVKFLAKECRGFSREEEFEKIVRRSFEKYRPYFDQPRNGQKLGTSSGLNRNNDNGYKSHNPSPCLSQTVSGKMSSRGSKSTNHKVAKNIEHSVSQSTKL